jgi:hypothetical protein
VTETKTTVQAPHGGGILTVKRWLGLQPIRLDHNGNRPNSKCLLIDTRNNSPTQVSEKPITNVTMRNLEESPKELADITPMVPFMRSKARRKVMSPNTIIELPTNRVKP